MAGTTLLCVVIPDMLPNRVFPVRREKMPSRLCVHGLSASSQFVNYLPEYGKDFFVDSV